jgi:hypothetical protein
MFAKRAFRFQSDTLAGPKRKKSVFVPINAENCLILHQISPNEEGKKDSGR